jgi:hypothetical protein
MAQNGAVILKGPFVGSQKPKKTVLPASRGNLQPGSVTPGRPQEAGSNAAQLHALGNPIPALRLAVAALHVDGSRSPREQ